MAFEDVRLDLADAISSTSSSSAPVAHTVQMVGRKGSGFKHVKVAFTAAIVPAE